MKFIMFSYFYLIKEWILEVFRDLFAFKFRNVSFKFFDKSFSVFTEFHSILINFNLLFNYEKGSSICR